MPTPSASPGSPIDRRSFIRRTTLATGGLTVTAVCQSNPSPPRVRWTRNDPSRLFTGVACDGEPLVRREQACLLDAGCRLWSEDPAKATRLTAGQPAASHGPLRLELTHQLHDSGGGHGEDLLAATLTVRNPSAEPQQIEMALITGVHPGPEAADLSLYLPLTAAGLNVDKRFAELGVKDFLKDCEVTAGPEEFRCHYLEPLASHPDELTTRAMLLAPVVDIAPPQAPWRVALFTPSDEPIRFATSVVPAAGRQWRISRVVTVPAGGVVTQRAWLLVHPGDAAVAWRAFHRFGHDEVHPAIDWTSEFKVHYYDFLSSAQGKQGKRGDGYDAALPHFRRFRVGLATQHGYYPCMGDHLHPDRKQWLAMQGDARGPVPMSFEIIRERIKATRATGAKAGIYMHMSALDDSSARFYPGLAAGRRIDAAGQPVRFSWNGPDVKGNLWWMSMSSPEWRQHLLQQAAWIMEVFKPDAICMDETFSGLGYNHAGGQAAPLSAHAIGFFKELHALVRSHGEDKALFSSDCSMAAFSLWADGEVGDHAYPTLLGHPLYSQEPVRYLAALGDKPWRPCAWHFQGMWQRQMQLARLVGAGVGVSNGWAEFTGLAGLPEPARTTIPADIATLFAEGEGTPSLK